MDRVEDGASRTRADMMGFLTKEWALKRVGWIYHGLRHARTEDGPRGKEKEKRRKEKRRHYTCT
jgi:hypothetical protein